MTDSRPIRLTEAELEIIESGESTVDDEFMANIMLPTGETLGEWAHPQIEAAYESGQMPKLLPGS